MARFGRWALAAGVLGLVVGVPLGYSSYRQTNLRNFGVVEDGVLYRSGQLSPRALDRALTEYRIRTVVCLRDADRGKTEIPDAWEEARCRELGLKYVRITPRVWSVDDSGTIPAGDAIREFLATMDDPANHPVLVHCMAGIHRTGQMCAVYRMEQHRWTVDEAMAEMEAFGYDLLDMHQDVSSYLRAYRPRWQR